MLNSTPLQALITSPDCTCANARDPLAQLCGIEILITERGPLDVVGDGPESVEGVKCTTIVAVQRAEEKRWFAIYCGLAHGSRLS